MTRDDLRNRYPTHNQALQPKCTMCRAPAEVQVRWPITGGMQQHNVCDACGHAIWDRLGKDFTGTEAYLCFTIEPLECYA